MFIVLYICIPCEGLLSACSNAIDVKSFQSDFSLLSVWKQNLIQGNMLNGQLCNCSCTSVEHSIANISVFPVGWPILFLSDTNLKWYSKVMAVFIKAAEYMEIPVRRSDDEPLHRLFMVVRSELNLDLKNIKQEQAKFWKQHPALVKVPF